MPPHPAPSWETTGTPQAEAPFRGGAKEEIDFASVADVEDGDLLVDAAPHHAPAPHATRDVPVSQSDVLVLRGIPTPHEARPLGKEPSRLRRFVSQNRGTVAVWGVSLFIGMTIVVQRSGALFSVAEFVGQGQKYEELENEYLGGPGDGTVRDARNLWRHAVVEATVPFSKVEARTAQQQ